MRFVFIAVVLAAAIALRLWMRQRSGRRGEASEPRHRQSRFGFRWAGIGKSLGDVGLVARREIRERVHSRIFRIGTIVILAGVAAAIAIPAIGHGASTPQRVGVVGTVTPTLTKVVESAGTENGTGVRVVPESSFASAKDSLQSGVLDVVVDGDRVVVDQPISSDSNSTTASLAQTLATELGILRTYQAAGLSAAQIAQVAHAKPVPVHSLQAETKRATKGTSVVGVILLFIMLTQYNTWILMGVMQEKASRVVEVLLATVRPIQLLGGKVLGIGLVAMGQAALIVAVALVVAAAVGSDLLHGTAPLVLLSQLLWLLLGYAFYCWVYAAAGSMAERQDQVQTLVLPLSLPIILGYVLSITAASSGHVSLFFEVLAYIPLTAPFAMPVLVGLGDVMWWQFVASVLLSIGGTALMAWAASGVYKRAVLQSGQRVRLRQITSGWARRRTAAPDAIG